MADEEAETRGRKDKKRTRPANDDSYDITDGRSKSKARSQTPAQRSITAKKIVREKSVGRREGSVPARLPYKMVPAEQERLAKKIVARTFKHKIEVNEADRHVATKRPKYLYSGKMSKGTSYHR